MRVFFCVFLSLFLFSCSTRSRQKVSNPKINSEKLLEDNTPLYEVPKTEDLPAYEQDPITGDFSTIYFENMNGYDGLFIDINAPKDNTLRKSNSRIEFKACPLKIDITDEVFQHCLEGYTRKLQFWLPMFAERFSLNLKICNETECLYSDNFQDLKNENPLTSDAEDYTINLFKHFIHQEKTIQSYLKEINIFYDSLQILAEKVESCPNDLSETQKKQLISLSSLSRRNLEDFFIKIDLNTVKNYISPNFLKEVDKLFDEDSMIGEAHDFIEDTVPEILASTGTAVATIAGSYYGLSSYAAWQKELRNRRALIEKDSANNEIRKKLIRDKRTGFYVEPKEFETLKDKNGKEYKKYKKYYIPDIMTEKPLRAGESGDYVTIDDPAKFEINGKTVGIRRVEGSIYQYNYQTGRYVLEDKQGKLLNTEKGPKKLGVFLKIAGGKYTKIDGVRAYPKEFLMDFDYNEKTNKQSEKLKDKDFTLKSRAQFHEKVIDWRTARDQDPFQEAKANQEKQRDYLRDERLKKKELTPKSIIDNVKTARSLYLAFAVLWSSTALGVSTLELTADKTNICNQDVNADTQLNTITELVALMRTEEVIIGMYFRENLQEPERTLNL